MAKKKKLFRISVVFAVSIAIGIGSYLCVSRFSSIAKEWENDKKQTADLVKRFAVAEEYVREKKKELKDWNAVGYRLMQEKHSFSPDEATELRDIGYLASDIARAQQLAVDSGVDKMKILKSRGTYPGIRSWKDVIKALRLDVREDAEKWGLSKKDISYFKARGLSTSDINSIAVMCFQKHATVESVKEALEQGKTVENLYQEYLKKESGGQNNVEEN